MKRDLMALNKAYRALENKLARGEFDYKVWMELADLYPIGSRRARDIRKAAARMQKERSMNNG